MEAAHEYAGPIRFNLTAPELWGENCVLSGRTTRHITGPHEGTLSIKTVLDGRAVWRTPDRRFVIEPGVFLVLNEGQTYELEVETHTSTQTLAIFFRPGLIEGILQAKTTEVSRMLEQGEPAPYGFDEKLHLTEAGLEKAFRILARQAIEGGDSDSASMAFDTTGSILIESSLAGRRQRQRLRHASAATRDEVLRRLNRARDAMLSSSSIRFGLDQFAAEACLSPHYFHELFSEAFGETPHQFRTKARIERARLLLQHTDWSILAICQELGFESVSSFTKLFRRYTGVNPGELRKSRRFDTLLA
jgi:AraC-like DNA-binding protein